MLYIIHFLCVELSLITIPITDNCTNPFCNNIFNINSCNSIVDNWLYLVSEHFSLWAYIFILRVINYDYWSIRVKFSFLRIILLRGLYSISYHLKLCRRKRLCFGVALGSIMYWLLTGFNWFWVLPYGSTLLSWNISSWTP